MLLLLQVQTPGLHSLSQQELQLRSTVAKLVNTEETYEVISTCMSRLTSACISAAASTRHYACHHRCMAEHAEHAADAPEIATAAYNMGS